MQKLRIDRLKLTNFRCFAELDITFHPQLTVLVARNGAGKTAVLDAVAVALGPYVGAFDEAAGKHFESGDIRCCRVRKTASHEMEYAADGVALEAFGVIPSSPRSRQNSVSWVRTLSGPTKSKTTIKGAQALIEYGKRLQREVRTPDSNAVLPVLSYYGTGRLWQLKKLTPGKLERTSRTIGYTGCLDSGSSYKAFAEWFRYWYYCANERHMKAWKEGKPSERSEFDDYLDSIKGAVNTCLAPSGWKNIDYAVDEQALVAEHDEQGRLPISQLSDGVRNMIGMVADIAFRATKLNPDFAANAAQKSPGIILIDEVDMHLHPGWQQTVLAGLTQAFPEMQFIVTTHSPQVLTTVAAECIRLLQTETGQETGAERTVVRSVNQQTLGIASSDVLAAVMDTDPVPDVDAARDLQHYHALIQQNLYETAEGTALHAKLVTHFGAGHPVMLECNRLMRLQAFKRRLPIREPRYA